MLEGLWTIGRPFIGEGLGPLVRRERPPQCDINPVANDLLDLVDDVVHECIRLSLLEIQKARLRLP